MQGSLVTVPGGKTTSTQRPIPTNGLAEPLPHAHGCTRTFSCDECTGLLDHHPPGTNNRPPSSPFWVGKKGNPIWQGSVRFSSSVTSPGSRIYASTTHYETFITCKCTIWDSPPLAEGAGTHVPMNYDSSFSERRDSVGFGDPTYRKIPPERPEEAFVGTCSWHRHRNEGGFACVEGRWNRN
jgi:hypothetical protein